MSYSCKQFEFHDSSLGRAGAAGNAQHQFESQVTGGCMVTGYMRVFS